MARTGEMGLLSSLARMADAPPASTSPDGSAGEPTPVAVLPGGGGDGLAKLVAASPDAELTDPSRARAVVWWAPADHPEVLDRTLVEHDGIEWIQLPWAGVEPYVDVIRAHPDRRWTCAKGAYAAPVAEHALALGLGGLRGIVHYGEHRHWKAGFGPDNGEFGTTLTGGHVTIVGGGGIAQRLVAMLVPFEAHVTVVRRTPQPMPGVHRVLGADDLRAALPGADLVVLALPVTPDTVGLIGARELELMERHAWLVNVARGVHVVTDDLVAALREGTIGGAGLDVTDPEPLPDDHPLWHLPNCRVTPHVADTLAMAAPLLADRVTENLRRFRAGEPLVGPVDPAAGY